MALYIPSGTRKRRTALVAIGAVVVGLVLGFGLGRSTAPTPTEQIRSVQADAREVSSGLRVLALHDEAGTIATQGSGDGGAALVLAAAEKDLAAAIRSAPWISASEGKELRAALVALAARDDRTDASFGRAAEATAKQIDAAFGNG